MPTYDYACTTCTHVFETVHAMSESPHLPCPQCGGLTEKKFSPGAGLLFKASGFYVTDSASSGAGGKSTPEASPGCASPTGESCHGGSCAMNNLSAFTGD